jgi:hypothetical protein
MPSRVIPRTITKVTLCSDFTPGRDYVRVEYYSPPDSWTGKPQESTLLQSDVALPLKGAGVFRAPLAGVELVEWVVDDAGQFFVRKNGNLYRERFDMCPTPVADLLRLARGSDPEWRAANLAEIERHLADPPWMVQARAAGWLPPA